MSGLPAINLPTAEALARGTDYAWEAQAVPDATPIHWPDAGAFFLEGYRCAMRRANGRSYPREREVFANPPPDPLAGIGSGEEKP